MKNRRFLILLLVLAVFASLFAGCGKKKDSEAKENKTVATDEKNKDKAGEDKKAAEAGTPDADQYLKTFTDMQPTTIDPSKGSDVYGYGIINNILEPLVRMDEDKDGKIFTAGAGAEKWEVSSDGLTYTFHLRDNSWSDGQPVKASDYVYGIQRTILPETASPYANLIYPIANAVEINKGEKDVKELGVEAKDDKTLVITLKQPLPYFMEYLTQRVYMPQREDKVKEWGEEYFTAPEKTVACGPFILDNWTINSEMNFVKNEKFWNAANIKLTKINQKIIADPNTIYLALEKGDLDYASVRDPKWQKQFLDSGDYRYLKRDNPFCGYLMYNATKGKVTSNAKIRQAIGIALDRQELIDATMNGTPRPAYAFVPPSVTINNQTFNEFDKGPLKDLIDENPDPKKLFIEGMKELGLGEDPSKVTIKFEGSGNEQDTRLMTEFIQQSIQDKIGCKFEVTNNDWNAFSNKLKSLDYDVCWLGWSADFNDPSNFLETMYSKAPAYDTGWKNAEFDELLEKAQSENDVAKRTEMLHKAEKILVHDEAEIVPINYGVANIFTRNYIKGTGVNYFNTMGYQKIYTEGRPSK